MNLENIIGSSGRNISDFHIYHKYILSSDENDNYFSICVVFVDGLYEAYLVNENDGIILKTISYARNKYNLYQILFDKTNIKEYDDMVEEKILSMSTDEDTL